MTGWFALLPVVIAVIFAAPFALELERGTYRLAWTQSITRRRWLAAKLTVALGGAGVAAASTALLLTWWRRPLDNFHGRVEPGAFQLEGIAPIAYAVFAAALIIALGTILRRTIAAIAIGIVAFLAVRVVIESLVRPHFASALRSSGRDEPRHRVGRRRPDVPPLQPLLGVPGHRDGHLSRPDARPAGAGRVVDRSPRQLTGGAREARFAGARSDGQRCLDASARALSVSA